MLKLSGLSVYSFRRLKQGEQAIRTGIMSQRYPANHTFDTDIIRLMIPLNLSILPLNKLDKLYNYCTIVFIVKRGVSWILL
jgi:hypothetical protein